MSITRGWCDFVIANVNIVDYISKHEELTSIGGGEWQGPHSKHSTDDNSTALNVNEAKGVYHCYSCNESGNVISFEAQRSNCDTITACQNIASQMGLNLPEFSEGNVETERKKQVVAVKISEIIKEAHGYFTANLTDERKTYLLSRGLTDDTIADLQLGYAPDQKRGLYQYLLGKGYDKEDVKSTGLINKGYYDHFCDYYIFPYKSGTNTACYFIGRNNGPEYEDIGKDKPLYRGKYKKHIVNGKGKEHVNEIAVQHVIWGANELPRQVKTRPELYRNEKQPVFEPAEKRQIPKVLITEGILDAILARQEFGLGANSKNPEYYVISPITTRIKKQDIAMINDALVKLGKCDVIFANDNDSNGSGLKGALDTANLLAHDNYMLHLTEGQRIENSDAKKDSAWKEWMDANGGAEGYANANCARVSLAFLPRPPEFESVDLADYVQNKWTDELRYWIDPQNTLSLDKVKLLLENDPDRFNNSVDIVNELQAVDNEFYHAINQRIYYYNQGYYQLDNNEDQITRKIIAKLGRQKKIARVNEALQNLAFINRKFRYKEGCLINCANKLIDWKDGKSYDHTHDYLSFAQIPINLVQGAECPAIDEFLSQVIPEDCIDLFWESLGYCFLPHNDHHYAVIYLGHGSNGKSTALHVIRSILGEQNVSGVSLDKLEENPYAVSKLVGKLANICEDIPDKFLKKTDTFKLIASGEPVLIEEKYKVSYSARINAKLLFSANKMPNTADKSYGFLRRWLPIPFPNTFDESNRNVNLKRELTTQSELEGAFLKALQAIMAVEDPETKGFSIPESSKEVIADYQEQNDHVLSFCNECIVKIEDGFIANSALLKSYNQWCEVENVKPLGRNKFRSAFDKHMGNPVNKNVKNVRGYVNLELTSDRIVNVANELADEVSL